MEIFNHVFPLFSGTNTTSRAPWQLLRAHMSPSWFLDCRGPGTTPKSGQVSQNMPHLCTECEKSFKSTTSLVKPLTFYCWSMYGDIQSCLPSFFPGHKPHQEPHDNSTQHTCLQAGFWTAEGRKPRQNPDRSVSICLICVLFAKNRLNLRLAWWNH